MLKRNELLENLKNAKFNDLEDLVYRLQITYEEIKNISDLKYSPTKRTGCSLTPGIYEVVDLNNTLKFVSPDNVKVRTTVDDNRLKSNLKINQVLILTNKSFFYKTLVFTQSHSYSLDDIEESYQLIAGSHKSEKPINITGINKTHLKCDCNIGSFVNGIREPVLYSFAPVHHPDTKYLKNQE